MNNINKFPDGHSNKDLERDDHRVWLVPKRDFYFRMWLDGNAGCPVCRPYALASRACGLAVALAMGTQNRPGFAPIGKSYRTLIGKYG